MIILLIYFRLYCWNKIINLPSIMIRTQLMTSWKLQSKLSYDFCKQGLCRLFQLNRFSNTAAVYRYHLFFRMRLSYILLNEKTMIRKTLLFVLIRMKSKYKLKNHTKSSNNLADGCVCVCVCAYICHSWTKNQSYPRF